MLKRIAEYGFLALGAAIYFGLIIRSFGQEVGLLPAILITVLIHVLLLWAVDVETRRR